MKLRVFSLILLSYFLMYAIAFLTLVICLSLASCAVRGVPGPVGKPCTTVQDESGVEIYCPDGSVTKISDGLPGADGAQGPQGPQGDNGSKGDTGDNGQYATPVTLVELCPNQGPTHYPDHFPEQLLCIASKLYGVYWTGSQAFLAEIPPGVYSSTSPQGCSATVGPNCQVTQN